MGRQLRQMHESLPLPASQQVEWSLPLGECSVNMKHPSFPLVHGPKVESSIEQNVLLFVLYFPLSWIYICALWFYASSEKKFISVHST